jgi:hypothetical protein
VIVQENPEAASRLFARVRAERPPRTSGYHASDVLRCLRQSWHKHNFPEMYKEGAAYGESDRDTVTFLLGESAHIFLGGKTSSEKSIPYEGLSCTPDEASREGNEFWPPIREYKTTSRSSSKGIPDLGDYVAQAALYCLAMDVNEASIFVIFSRGNYKFGPDGTFVDWKYWDVEFSARELEWWAREIRRRRDLLGRAQRLSDIPASENWDPKIKKSCSFCGLKRDGLCEGGGEWQAPFPSIEQR